MNEGGGGIYGLNTAFLGSGRRKTSGQAEPFLKTRMVLGFCIWEASSSLSNHLSLARISSADMPTYAPAYADNASLCLLKWRRSLLAW